jgi:tRNA pseudouridine55 synthase
MLSGILNLDKPPGLSSAAALNRIKPLLPRGVKIGHAGTLDPFATGVLLVLIGKATRSCEQLMNLPKSYETTIRFGATTPTDDPTAEPAPVPGATAPTPEQVAQAINLFTGVIQQKPPVFSAMKIAGRRAYDLARKGKAVELAARPVRVDAIGILSYQWPDLRLTIDCGRGTYIRAIARDLGQALAVGGYLSALRRTKVGPFIAAEAISLDRVLMDGPAAHIRPVPVGL